MSRLSGSGIGVEVPPGWEGRIYSKQQNAVVHLASFALPPRVGDYGGGATELMTNTDLFVIVMEHGDASANTPLFAAQGIPRVRIEDVSTTRLQRMLEGQGGAQKFFTTADRAFCLYVVFGSYARRSRTIPVVNDILKTLTIARR